MTQLRLWARLRKIAGLATDDEIIGAISPFMLSCAVGFFNHEWQSPITFDYWFMLCETTWVPECRKSTGASANRIKSALLGWVKAHAHRGSMQIIRDVELERGAIITKIPTDPDWAEGVHLQHVATIRYKRRKESSTRY